MQIYDRVDQIKSDNSFPAGGPPFAQVSRALVDGDNATVIAVPKLSPALGATLKFSAVPICVKISVTKASIIALGAVTSGDITLANLPAKSVVTFTAMKPTEAVTGGAVAATGTLTSDNTNVSDADTVTIGNKTYTFKTALTPTEGQVLIGADADGSLLNLIRAINHTGTPNTDYKCAAAHTQVTAAASVTAHAFLITSIGTGAAANALATTEASSHLSFGAATLTGGLAMSAATGRIITANNNYGSAYDIKQAIGDTIVDPSTSAPKLENSAAVTALKFHFVATGANASTLVTGAADCWVTYFVRP